MEGRNRKGGERGGNVPVIVPVVSEGSPEERVVSSGLGSSRRLSTPDEELFEPAEKDVTENPTSVRRGKEGSKRGRGVEKTHSSKWGKGGLSL